VTAAKATAAQLFASSFKEAVFSDHGEIAAVALAASHLVAMAGRSVGYDSQKPEALAD
jgi:hypothetical protein